MLFYTQQMLEILNVRKYAGGLEQAARYFHEAWSGIHLQFYLDALEHSSMEGKPLPRFYLALIDGQPIGCYGLVVNDFISRHDLYPWFAALYIDPRKRGRAFGSVLLEHGLRESADAGFENLYLTTDHDGYYEKYGWIRIEDGYERDGSPARIYCRNTGH
jgi:N-acetylglutamate synthase-like GNAT family acetyltransferase